MKKKVVSTILTVMLFSLSITTALGITTTPARAQTKPTLKLEPDFYFAKELNEEFDINVTIYNVDAASRLIGIHFRLYYDPELLKVISVSEGEFMPKFNQTPTPPSTLFMWFIEEDGIFGPHIVVGEFLFPNATGQWPGPFPEGNGTVATIRFKVVYRPVEPNPIAICVLRFIEVMLLDDQGNEIEYATGISLYQSPVPMLYPKSAFTYSPKYPMAGQAILFDARSSTDPDGKIVTYIWDFGDGTTLSTSENTTTHVYNQPRTYNVTLRVIDNDGLVANISKLVDVNIYTPIEIRIETGEIYYPGEKAEFYISTSQLGKPIAVSFTKIWLYYNGSLYEDLSSLAQPVDDGLYLIVYTVPEDAEVGVYMLFVEAEYLNITGIGTASFQISDLLDVINATLIGIEGTVAYVNSTLGTLTVSIQNINLTVTEIKRDMATGQEIATIQTSLGTIEGKVVAIEGNVTKIATIETNLGYVKADVSSLIKSASEVSGSQGTLTTLAYVTLLFALIAAVAAIINFVKMKKA